MSLFALCGCLLIYSVYGEDSICDKRYLRESIELLDLYNYSWQNVSILIVDTGVKCNSHLFMGIKYNPKDSKIVQIYVITGYKVECDFSHGNIICEIITGKILRLAASILM